MPSPAALEALLESCTPMDEVQPYFKAMVFGESGTGKTILAATGVVPGTKGLYIDSGEGWVSLIDFPHLRKNLTRMQYQGISQIDAVCDAFENGIEPWCDYSTIILDECSTIATLDLDVVLAARAKADPSKDANMPTQPDYGHNTERMRRVLTRLLKLNCNVILTAHIREDKDERTGRVYTRPSFTPKLRNTIMQQLHLCGHLTVTERNANDTVEYDRKLQVRPSMVIAAKSRIKALPVFLENPDLGQVIIDWQNSGAVVDDTPEVLLPMPDAPVAEESDASVESSLEI